jgi:hypothetical protein
LHGEIEASAGGTPWNAEDTGSDERRENRARQSLPSVITGGGELHFPALVRSRDFLTLHGNVIVTIAAPQS